VSAAAPMIPLRRTRVGALRSHRSRLPRDGLAARGGSPVWDDRKN